MRALASASRSRFIHLVNSSVCRISNMVIVYTSIYTWSTLVQFAEETPVQTYVDNLPTRLEEYMSESLLPEYEIRDLRSDEYPLLEEFLYGAIFVPADFEGEVPRSIIYDDPMCRAAFENFGSREDDIALVATLGDNPIGACWVRTTNEYGHIDDRTPSFSISLHEPYRGNGIGTALMTAMLEELRSRGFGRASLSVQKENPAARLYQRLGFEIIGDGADETEWLMLIDL